MVHHRGVGTEALDGALPAEWFPEKLGGSEIVSPDRQTVPVVPGRTLPPACWFGLMGRTPAVPGQSCAAWVMAWPQWFARHGLSPPGKAKTPEPRSNLLVGHGLRRSTLWPLSIFKITVDLQSRQKIGRFLASVSGSTRIRRWFRLQTGQATHPSFTTSLSHCGTFCNLFKAQSPIIIDDILTPKTENQEKLFFFSPVPPDFGSVANGIIWQ